MKLYLETVLDGSASMLKLRQDLAGVETAVFNGHRIFV